MVDWKPPFGWRRNRLRWLSFWHCFSQSACERECGGSAASFGALDESTSGNRLMELICKFSGLRTFLERNYCAFLMHEFRIPGRPICDPQMNRLMRCSSGSRTARRGEVSRHSLDGIQIRFARIARTSGAQQIRIESATRTRYK